MQKKIVFMLYSSHLPLASTAEQKLNPKKIMQVPMKRLSDYIDLPCKLSNLHAAKGNSCGRNFQN
jgi:hypothetical protein